jgi:hypothetical protein
MPARASGYCFAHDGAVAEQRRAARSRGGMNKRTTIRAARLTASTLGPVLEQLLTAIDGVIGGSMDPRSGAALAQLATAVVKLYEAGMQEQQLSDALGRLAELERAKIS